MRESERERERERVGVANDLARRDRAESPRDCLRWVLAEARFLSGSKFARTNQAANPEYSERILSSAVRIWKTTVEPRSHVLPAIKPVSREIARLARARRLTLVGARTVDPSPDITLNTKITIDPVVDVDRCGTRAE